MRLIIALVILLCPVAALAAGEPPPPDINTADWLKALYEAITAGQWKIVAGLVLVGLVAAFMRYTPLKPKSKPGKVALAFALSLAGTIGVALGAGADITLATFATAISTAATAAGVLTWIQDYLEHRDSRNLAA
jgi:hypothetical protein